MTTPNAAPPERPSSWAALLTLQEGVRIALDALRANRIRSALTILGVAVGVSVVVMLAALITGIRSEVMVAFESAGPNNFTIMRFDFTAVQLDGSGGDDWWSKPEITPAEAERVAAIPGIREALYMVDTQVGASWEGARVPNVATRGTSPGWPAYSPGEFLSGRDFTHHEVQTARPVVIVSAPLAEELFGLRDPVGRRIRMSAPGNGVQQDFTVIGVYEQADNVFAAALRFWSVVPYTAAMKRLGASDEQAVIYVVPEDGVTQLQAQDRVIAALRAERRLRPREENDFAMLGSAQILSLFDRLTGVFFLVMMALSSAGLMVGGVGVVGIMLISVTERTREIGIRKAVGATRREILWQFLVEASFLTVLGGAVGLAFGAAVAYGVASFTPIPARIPLWSVAAALGMAAVTGMLFGLLPAYRAAKLEPVVALRAE